MQVYQKLKINENVEVQITVEDEVYCKCPICGKEMKCSLSDLLFDSDDLRNITLYCSSDCENKREKYGHLGKSMMPEVIT